MQILCKSERLILRKLELSDADFVLELINEPAFIQHIHDKQIRTLEHAHEYLLNGPWTNQARAGYGQFAIQTKADATVIGVCGLLYREEQEFTDVGFALLERCWGKGYATEAARAVIEFGKQELGLERIGGIVSPDNQASIRVLEKLGMKQQGTFAFDNGENCLLYL